MKSFSALLFILTLSTPAKADVSAACQGSETWTTEGSTAPSWMNQYRDFVSGKTSPVYSFSQAIQLKRISALLVHSEFERDFSEFWVGRILYQLKLDALAQQVFRSVYENAETPTIKKASFVCMTQIQKRSPDWGAPSGLAWMKLGLKKTDADAVFLASLKLPAGQMSGMASGLPEPHRAFLSGLDAVAKHRYPEAIANFKKFNDYFATHSDAFLEHYRNDARLYLARSEYSMAKFKDAADDFQKVSKTSNQQIDAMSDLSWAYLLDEKYGAAIGIAMQLRAGVLRNTFAPEPLMVAAMALNELCLYPDSIRMTQAFVNDYSKTHEWLTANPNPSDLYSEVLKVLKGKSTVPSKVATEWLKNPSFLSRQKELNLLIETPKMLTSIHQKAVLEQNRLTHDFIENSQKFIKEVRIAKLKLKPGESLDPSYADRYLSLKRDLRNLSHYYRASRTWKGLAHRYQHEIPSLRSHLVAAINTDLKKQNRQMLSLLDKVRDNSDLIEVEIYNGASQDMIWKNAHPDFEKLSESLKDPKPAVNSAKTWNWGRMPASDVEHAEVWEDELGALKADISSQCDERERYQKLKLIQK